ncbi:sensor histidine kinase [Marinithermus hydrothermalis]|uniref:histidine kinase n=1 Tax=Marinithermus hydrothermalis (strain DSM 14884 / JCM 11576 / T1) TaxID=869210 RepID=F2NLH1_MARHT|nr:HAMP domain-containing sensor histidine kinase [Marinithermus hydrothermalis]AEB12070.1 integral membrane sensor signal transduction histidine kinase [Marinithermus hydrothermalis DSM 14884]
MTASLKVWLTLTISLLAFIPNVLVVLGLLHTLPERPPLLDLRLILWILLLAVISALSGLYLTRRLLASLEELTRTFRYLKISPRNLPELHLPPAQHPLPQEVRELRAQFEALLDHFRREAQAREMVFATLAHDLKTPLLAAARAVAYLEEADDIGKERRKELLRQIQHELTRAHRLVENLLTASRLETTRPLREPLNLRPLLEDLRLRHLEDAEAHGVQVTIEGSGTARADRLLLERAVANLVDNAIRHARNTVVLRASDGWIEVEDDGPGLPAPLEALSQPFRSQHLRGVPAGSAGLGLYIARQVAEAHQGRLTLRPGTLAGACLRIEIPDPWRAAPASTATTKRVK